MTALVVDDSRAMRSILTNIVVPLGFEVVEASNGREALAQLEQHQDVEFVLLDWNMPVMSGFEFVQLVRATAEYNRVKIVMVTTETEPHQMARALMAGADEFVMKPFTPQVLLDKLRLIGVACEGKA